MYMALPLLMAQKIANLALVRENRASLFANRASVSLLAGLNYYALVLRSTKVVD